jgi:ABC-type multidrug transport system fused ATPase/permease subunit
MDVYILLKFMNLSKQDLGLISRCFSFMKPYRIKYVIFITSTLLLIVSSLIQPMIWGRVVQQLVNKSFSNIGKNILYLLLLYLAQSVANFIKSNTSAYLNNSIAYDIRLIMYRKMLDLTISEFEKMRIGDFISRLQGDIEALSGIITDQLLNSIIDILKIIVLGIIIFSINYKLALIVIVAFPCSYYMFTLFGKILRIKKKSLKEQEDNYFSILQQSLHGIRYIKSNGIKDYNFKQFRDVSDNIRKKSFQIAKLNNMSFLVSDFINYFDNILVICLSSFYIIKNVITIQYFIAFISYSNQFSTSLQNITRLNSNIQQMIVSLERIFKFLDSFSVAKEAFGNTKIERAEGRLSFQNVNFSYDNNNYVIIDINANINTKEITAIIGKSGSGKSTIFNLILRMYDSYEGLITIDGIDIKELDEESLRKNISIVHQEPFLFNLSIRNNLLIVCPNATDTDIEEVCRQAYIHDYILKLPNKYDTIINENGSNFSVGQKQRLTIARSLLRKSSVIIFDEPTAALDKESQYFIKKTVENVSREKTVIISTHDLDLIKGAKQILIIDDKRIIANGSHESLINTNKLYTQLYNNKFDVIENIEVD